MTKRKAQPWDLGPMDIWRLDGDMTWSFPELLQFPGVPMDVWVPGHSQGYHGHSPGIPIFGATPGQAVEFTTLAEAGLLRFHELQKLQPWNRLPTRLDLKTKSQKFASFHLGLQNRIPMDTSKTVDHHVLMEVAQNVGPPKSSKSLAFVLVLKAMVNPPF